MSTGPRRARPADVDGVAALWLALLAHHAARDPELRVKPGSEPEWRRLAGRLLADPDAAVFVWPGKNGLLGFAAARLERPPPLLSSPPRAEITELFVRPEARRGGIGRGLVAAFEAWLRQHGVLRARVQVAADNSEAQSFWRALGFADCVDVLERRV